MKSLIILSLMAMLFSSCGDGSGDDHVGDGGGTIECVSEALTPVEGLGDSAYSPIVICNYNDLQAISQHGLNKYYVLGRDIDASASRSEGVADCAAYEGATDPSGASSSCTGGSLGELTGFLDGKGYRISNFYRFTTSADDKIGLFASISADASLKGIHMGFRCHFFGRY